MMVVVNTRAGGGYGVCIGLAELRSEVRAYRLEHLSGFVVSADVQHDQPGSSCYYSLQLVYSIATPKLKEKQ